MFIIRVYIRDFTYVDDVVESIFELYKKTKNQKIFTKSIILVVPQ